MAYPTWCPLTLPARRLSRLTATDAKQAWSTPGLATVKTAVEFAGPTAERTLSPEATGKAVGL